MNSVWSEEKVARMLADGCGQGEGSNYRPWVTVTSFSSLGVSRRVPSPKFGRRIHLLSDVEYKLFLALEWSEKVLEVYEQYPLDRDATQEVARKLGIRHPCYPQTSVPAVMTVDFLVMCQRGDKAHLVGFDAKRSDEAEKAESLAKLEIQRMTLAEEGIDHHLVMEGQFPATMIENIAWIRDALVKDDEQEEYPGFWDSMKSRMAAEWSRGSLPMPPTTKLADYCMAFDDRHGVQRGTGLRAARMLMYTRELRPDLSVGRLNAARLDSISAAAPQDRLKVVGGRR